jgi:hypothetical protein
MPQALGGLLKYAAKLKGIETGYLKDNPDLEDHRVRLKELVGTTSSDHPDWTIEKIVDEAGIALHKEIKTTSSIGAIDIDSLEAPSKERLNGSQLKDD